MELLTVLDDVLDDAQAVELLAAVYTARCSMRAVAERFQRGEMPESERRGWLDFIAETCPMIEAMIEKNRERNDD
ncbi:MAG: hypothetical protein M3Q39_13135 [Actinomycetota bacterium]|nr:hypothetical protein [Actinomycetota bacterium]